ncbi:MAG: DNA-3-methyladenine glycosylase I [Dehalococcoidia bacterium]|nr:DNA-3-methyladenine glycosylase I [Dehalococcoidia bacterium]
MLTYHDTEWGVPLHDDRKLFEFITLDAFQAGLSWSTVIRKRAAFDRAFDSFEPLKIARYSDKKIQSLLDDAGIIRNKAKINATVTNAKSFLAVQKEFGAFDKYIWRFVDGKPIVNRWNSMRELPAKTPLAETMSKDLIGRRFKFVGPTMCYAFMQAAGLVNDHSITCFRYKDLAKQKKS